MNKEKLDQWLKSRKNRKQKYDSTYLFEEIKKGDSASLARGITLLESTKKEDQVAAKELIQKSLPFIGKSIRIGITGVPGVGKSTFIESFGTELIEKGHKVAVLAIDPSSEKTHGSILGDKTRMEQLSSNSMAFIRPSPAGDSLGGVARKTRESIYLCELAGFNIVLIETVGVGQSETSVHSMVDFFLLLMLAGAGDELQGIKRGIMEMADLLVVTKADGDNLIKAKTARSQYQNALHLFPPNKNNWVSKALICSAFQKEDVNEIIKTILTFKNEMLVNGFFHGKRKEQDNYWFEETLKDLVLNSFYGQEEISKKLELFKAKITNGEISSFQAANELFENYKKEHLK